MNTTGRKNFRALGGGNGGVGSSSWATREIAALDFLANVPLEAERSIVKAGLDGEALRLENITNTSSGNSNSIKTDEEEEKVEIGNELTSSTRNSRAITSGAAIKERKKTVSASHIGWWDSLISKDNGFFAEHNAKQKEKDQLELESRLLELPTVTTSNKEPKEMDNLTALEEGLFPKTTPIKGSTTAISESSFLPKIVSNTGGASNLAFRNIAPAITSPPSNLYMPAPARRLEGLEATQVRIPLQAEQTEHRTRHRTLARQVAVREWEREMTHNASTSSSTIMNGNIQDGRLYFSAVCSYPVNVFSVIKYEPRKEAETLRRKKIEARGGGGTHFRMPERDWRGISYRELLPRKEPKNKAFNRMIEQGQKEAIQRRKMRRRRKRRKQRESNHDDKSGGSSSSEDSYGFYDNEDISDDSYESIDEKASTLTEKRSNAKNLLQFSGNEMGSNDKDRGAESDSDISSSSSEDSRTYVPGFLDDVGMVQGRHRQVMVGDRVTGCIMSSTIHFVKPSELKADLNKQFFERFDEWEPPKAQRKYIGARVVNGSYKMFDPTEESNDTTIEEERVSRRKLSIASKSEIEMETILRMPPSLTLSKIRSLKQTALTACVRADCEVSTVALACVYFERLALDCHVDKSNRRLVFAVCLLLATKMNESNVQLVLSDKGSKKGVLNSLIRPTKFQDTYIESLLVFFTHEWNLKLKDIFAAEWGVFAALGFSLNAPPSQVSFHFKRLMKAQEWSSLNYLGEDMYNYWQNALMEESILTEEKKQRKEERRQKQEKKILKLQRELHLKEEEAKNSSHSRRRRSSSVQSSGGGSPDQKDEYQDDFSDRDYQSAPNTPKKRKPWLRIGLKKSTSSLALSSSEHLSATMHAPIGRRGRVSIDNLKAGSDSKASIMRRVASSPNISRGSSVRDA